MRDAVETAEESLHMTFPATRSLINSDRGFNASRG